MWYGPFKNKATKMSPRQRTLSSNFVLQGKHNVHSHYGSFFYGCKQHVGSKRENYISLKILCFSCGKNRFSKPMISQRQKKQRIRSFRKRNRWKQKFYQDKIMALQIITIIQFKQVPLYRLDFSVCKPLVTLKQIICKAIITLPVSQTLWRI